MQHEECINAAYAETIQGLYKVMVGSYIAAGGNEQAENKAEDAFKAGVILARRIRARALAIVRDTEEEA